MKYDFFTTYNCATDRNFAKRGNSTGEAPRKLRLQPSLKGLSCGRRTPLEFERIFLCFEAITLREDPLFLYRKRDTHYRGKTPLCGCEALWL